MRVLGFAYQYVPRSDYGDNIDMDAIKVQIDQKKFNFTFAGLISLRDPPRKGVPVAVEKCRSAGIKVVMVTGDQPVTAEAISKDVGIITGKTNLDCIF